MTKRKEKVHSTRTVLKAVRVTEEEAMQLARQAEQYRMTESGYMRRRLFYGSQPRLPPETNAMLQRLTEQERRVGININQVVRSCNSKRFITKRRLSAACEVFRGDPPKLPAVLSAAGNAGGVNTTARNRKSRGGQQSRWQ